LSSIWKRRGKGSKATQSDAIIQQFTHGEGPQLDAIADRRGLTRLKAELDHRVLAPIYDAIKLSKAEQRPTGRVAGFLSS
jgi:hypothetical protein